MLSRARRPGSRESIPESHGSDRQLRQSGAETLLDFCDPPHPSLPRPQRKKGPNALWGAERPCAGSSGPALDSWQSTTRGSAQPCGHSRSRIPLLPPAVPAARPARPPLRFCSEPAPRSPDRAPSLPACLPARPPPPAAAPPARVAPPAPHSGGEGARPRPRGRGEGSRPGTPRGAARTGTGAAPALTSAMSPRRPPSPGPGRPPPRARGGPASAAGNGGASRLRRRQGLALGRTLPHNFRSAAATPSGAVRPRRAERGVAAARHRSAGRCRLPLDRGAAPCVPPSRRHVTPRRAVAATLGLLERR